MRIPKRKQGKQSAIAKQRYKNEVNNFYSELEVINEALPFKVSSRDWCYILEDHGLLKGDFKTALDKYLDYEAIQLFNNDTGVEQAHVKAIVRQLMKVA